MRTIHWNNLARIDFYKNIKYLLTKWSEKEAQIFIDKVFELEAILATGNVEFQNTNRPGIKRCVINKNISLFYRVVDKKNVELLRFWNNMQDIENIYFD
jgi:plasmid stabilization system protein ParE